MFSVKYFLSPRKMRITKFRLSVFKLSFKALNQTSLAFLPISSIHSYFENE